jgi:hypothetical protein
MAIAHDSVPDRHLNGAAIAPPQPYYAFCVRFTFPAFSLDCGIARTFR